MNVAILGTGSIGSTFAFHPARHGITVNNAQPRPIDADADPADGPRSEMILRTLPLRRYGTADEVAAFRVGCVERHGPMKHTITIGEPPSLKGSARARVS